MLSDGREDLGGESSEYLGAMTCRREKGEKGQRKTRRRGREEKTKRTSAFRSFPSPRKTSPTLFPFASLTAPSLFPANAPARAPGMLPTMYPSAIPPAPPTMLHFFEWFSRPISGSSRSLKTSAKVSSASAWSPEGRNASLQHSSESQKSQMEFLPGVDVPENMLEKKEEAEVGGGAEDVGGGPEAKGFPPSAGSSDSQGCEE